MSVGEARDAPAAGLVIVGASHAGVALAAAAREEGYKGAVMLVDGAAALPYQRPPLSKKFLEGGIDEDRLMLRAPDFYRENGIELRLGVPVSSFDPQTRTVRLEDGTVIGYVHLALATGTEAIRIDCLKGLEGVWTLRTLEDARSFRDGVTGRSRIGIVGAGFVGLEVAATLAASGRHRVTVVERSGRVASRSTSPQLGERLRSMHEEIGTRMIFGRSVVGALSVAGAVTALVLDNGTTVPVDAVLVGIGARPNIALAEQAGLACRDGILVDAGLRTSAGGVFALGDCAAAWQMDGRLTARLECIQNATDQARLLARVLTGLAVPVPTVPWFWTEQFGRRIQMAGLVGDADRSVAREGVFPGRFSLWHFRLDRLVALETIDAPGEHMLARRFLAGGTGPSPAQASDVGFDLRGALC